MSSHSILILVLGIATLGLLFYFFDLKRELFRQKNRLAKALSIQNALVNGDLNSERVMETITEKTIELVGADGATLEMLSGESLIYRSAQGILKDFKGFKVSVDHSLSGLSVKQGRGLICKDSETDERVDRNACRTVGVRSMIVFPLKHRGQLLGVLKAASVKPDFFNHEHLLLLEYLVGVLSATLGHAYQFEEKASLADRAEQTAKIKTELLANISHEIRSPLNSILGLTRLLSASSHRNKQMEYIGGIHNSGKLLQMLMNNLLDYSAIEAGKVELESIVFDLEEVVSTVKKAFLYQAQLKGIGMAVSFDPNVGTTVMGDPGRLSQVLMNLVGNALKFTSRGTISIRVKRVIDNDESKILFEVADTGTGMDEEGTRRLFKSFQQADVSISRKYGGTGLGLSISKRLVELMNGSITVQSEKGVGSVFSFTVLLPETENEIFRQPSEIKVPSSDFKILVAEDNHINQMVTVDMLERLGFSADTVSNGREAVSAVRTQQYDLVLMDCQMPEMSGYEATTAIRGEAQGGKRIPIIAITGNVFAGDRENCFAVGMDDYIPKPLEMKDLERVLGRWLPATACADEDEACEHVDLNRFKTVTGSFGPEKFSRISELVRVYLSSTTEYIDVAETSFHSKDFAKLGQKVHSIKSSSENIGAKILGKTAGEIEGLCRENAGQIQVEMIEAMKDEFDRVELDLKKLLNIIDRKRMDHMRITG